jgi:hypothetical protein
MAKKKISNRKHKFKYAEPTVGSAVPMMTAPAGSSSAFRTGNAATLRDFSYVSRDVGKIIVIAVILIIVELILWYSLAHSSLGKSVYSLIPV